MSKAMEKETTRRELADRRATEGDRRRGRTILHLFLILTALCWVPRGLTAQTADDRVVIDKSTETYRFVVGQNGDVTVMHERETTYELTGSLAEDVHPYVFYDDFITVDKASCGSLKANHRAADSEEVFHDGSKVCYFEATLTPKHRRLTARFHRTVSDARYLARVSLLDSYFIRHKTLTFIIPTVLSGVRTRGLNLPAEHAGMTAALVGSDSVFTYTVTDLPAWKSESLAPPYMQVGPQILVMGIFSDYHALYRWGHELAQVDTAIDGIDTLLARITAGCTTTEERLANTLQWVQQNIRYVAIEAGLAGHRPDRPAEVVRKRYGDCKGMSLLLTTLLRRQGFDARLADVGTRRIPYAISQCPSLAAVDHMVCAVMHDDRPPLLLDPTCSYLPVGYIPQHIQGREAMIDDGDDCLLYTVPTLAADSSVDSLAYDLQLDVAARRLEGQAVYAVRGDMKEFFMTSYERSTLTDKTELLARNLNADDRSSTVSDVAWRDADSRHEWACFGGKVGLGHAVQTVGDDVYVELNPHNTLFALRLDTLRRCSDFELPFECCVVRTVRLHLPEGYTVEHLPDGFVLDVPQGRLSCTFEQEADAVLFTQRMLITARRIARADVPAWNRSVSRWTDACNEQIILKRKP